MEEMFDTAPLPDSPATRYTDTNTAAAKVGRWGRLPRELTFLAEQSRCRSALKANWVPV